MEAPPSFATSIINSMSFLWKEEALADFTLMINDSIFKCHRSILGACSHFFYALFTTDMKEKKDNFAKLHDIDPSAFELILKILYTGENLITKENVFSIWQCAHRLQITFLVEYCEKLSISILSCNNFADFSRVATVFGSHASLEVLDKFILKNFMGLKDDKVFLEFSAVKLKEIIQSDALEVTREDIVLSFIYKWAESSSKNAFKSLNDTKNVNLGYCDVLADSLKNDVVDFIVQDHPEKHNTATSSSRNVAEIPGKEKDIIDIHKTSQKKSGDLGSLLKASRLCLASSQCLQKLYHHRLTQSDEEAKSVILEAILYQKGYHHGYFPPTALHRNSSELENACVIACGMGSFKALSMARNKWYPMPTCEKIKDNIQIATFKTNVYAVGQADDSNSILCILKDSSWTTFAELPGLRYLLVSHKDFLYVFNASNGKVHRMDPNSIAKYHKTLEHPRFFTNVEFAMSYKDYILVFSSFRTGGKEKTAVYAMNTCDEMWSRIENLDGPAKKMVTFKNGESVYVLQSNGYLWNLTSDSTKMISFEFIHKLWDAKESLTGALLYKDILFLFFKLLRAKPENKILPRLPGVYNSIQNFTRHGCSSNATCTIMHKHCLLLVDDE